MRLLLDTHAFLWFVLNDPLLSSNARNLIADPNNEIEISPATYWEIAIKIGIGKYSLAEPLVEQIPVVSVDAAFYAYPVKRLW